MARPISAIFVSALLAAGSIATDANAATVFSDSFESPVVVPPGNSGNGYQNYGTGSTIGPWTVLGTGPTDAVSVVPSSFSQTVAHNSGSATFTFPTQPGNGNQWADLAGQDANSPAGVKVTLNGLLGQKYTVSFWTGNLVNPGGPFGTTTTVNLLVNGVLAYTAFNAEGTGQTSLAWKQFVYQSPLASLTDQVTFTFLSGDGLNDYNAAFDSVVISTSVVPLPAALPLFATGLGVIGLIGWRRKRKAAAQAAAA